MTTLFKCIKQFNMSDGDIAFIKGKVYPAKYHGGWALVSEVQTSDEPYHHMCKQNIDKHFVKVARSWLTPSVDGFIAFCKSQLDTPCNHHRWGSCAIGCYLRHIGIEVAQDSFCFEPDPLADNAPYPAGITHKAQCIAVNAFEREMEYPARGIRHSSLYQYLNTIKKGTFADIVEHYNGN